MPQLFRRAPSFWGALILVLALTGVLLAGMAPALLAAKPSQILLTWQDSPQTTMTITWRGGDQVANGQASGVVYYTTEPERELATYLRRQAEPFTFAESKAQLYTAALTGLTPGATYTAIVENDGERSAPFTFRTIPEQRESLTFLAGGDSRSRRDVRQAINRLAANEDPAFILLNGDLINSALSEREWDEWFDDWHDLMVTKTGRRIPLLTAIGNHEVKGGNDRTKADAPFYYHRFKLPGEQSHYVVRFGKDLTLITLDTQHTTPIDGAQREWLQRTLEAQKDSRWIIVQYHVPAYPSVRGFDDKVSTLVRQHWVPLFEQYGVSLVIEAHDHAYKRTEPIFAGKVDADRGIVYIGDGAWGAPIRDPKNPADHWWLAEAAKADHYWRLTLSADGRTLEVAPVFPTPQEGLGAPFTLRKP